ncbi:hypothetical protein LguiA_036726 [Lonicera macranthoides]
MAKLRHSSSYTYRTQRSIPEGAVVCNVEHYVGDHSMPAKPLEDSIEIIRRCRRHYSSSSPVRAQSSCGRKPSTWDTWQQHSDSVAPTPNGYLSLVHYTTNPIFLSTPPPTWEVGLIPL